MSAYSPFFASGLLAPHHTATTPLPPSSPLLPPSDIDFDRSPTPTPSTAIPRTAHPDYPNTNIPRLRKRRSSITAAVSPFSNIKSPSRQAGAALQRHAHSMSVAVSPRRNRSGSITNDLVGGPASQANSMMGRLRSGSVGNGARSRRVLRAIPAVPPPTAPLPALPTVSPFTAPASMPSSRKRPALTHRPPLVENLIVPDFKAKFMAMTTPEMSPVDPDISYSSQSDRIDEDMKEN